MSDLSDKNTVLVIEDDDQIAYLLTYLLESEGYVVIQAVDGQLAQNMINDMVVPTLVLLDVSLPYIDGFDLLKLMRRLPEWDQVPIIMLSVKSEKKYIAKAFKAGVNDYVVKPFQPTELLDRIRRVIN